MTSAQLLPGSHLEEILASHRALAKNKRNKAFAAHSGIWLLEKPCHEKTKTGNNARRLE